MRRREFLGVLGGVAAAWPLAARAQQPAMPVIGLLSPFSRSDTEPWHQAFRQGLRELGWIEGENISIEYRYAEGRAERLPELVADLISHKVAAIVVAVTPDALAATKATKTIPIVMASAGDPVATGLVQNLARPGGNITGLSQMSTDLAAKRLELLKQVASDLSRVAVLWNPRDAISTLTWQEIQLPARRLDIELHSLEVQDNGEFDNAFATAIGAKVGAIYVLPAPIFVDNEKRIAEFAAKNHLPSVFHLPEYVRLGGLMAYGPDRVDLFRRAATYVDKILKGANPGDLPIEQPTKFELVINLKTAKALGLTVPPSVLMRADEVIE
jgi:putative tryptophan/tyrosine transport system substrate-binding protein